MPSRSHNRLSSGMLLTCSDQLHTPIANGCSAMGASPEVRSQRSEIRSQRSEDQGERSDEQNGLGFWIMEPSIRPTSAQRAARSLCSSAEMYSQSLAKSSEVSVSLFSPSQSVNLERK